MELKLTILCKIVLDFCRVLSWHNVLIGALNLVIVRTWQAVISFLMTTHQNFLDIGFGLLR